MRSKEWKRSAGTVVTGIVLLVVGQFVFQLGQQSAVRGLLESGYSDDDTGKGVVLIGGVTVLGGLVTLCWGVWQMAVNVDLAGLVAARHLAELEIADARAAEKEYRRAQKARRVAADRLAAVARDSATQGSAPGPGQSEPAPGREPWEPPAPPTQG
ncbi:hypothetical protein CWIS_13780 [Cellulomonas sp. A375-1]|uniref:hypothetical protein n=1 Tax=Cellulomonas sp. A375-1 TaxID=1672219 RepID=UPI000652650E|nr:hypothetical protein [Cellulomonas sp. A375-1]KMM44887.1 hypothetical protein CWIS_13780 [Cellulomonas sp. A375-1]